ncbi:RHS repeat-associated core domain-containing protein [Streptomyces mangrovi]|uniref:RHS repeat-associated core domain-containing protein n=1 Tax=Streptomyces mangrovi TaxID=1206892 RepID=UPI00399CB3D2
MTVSAGKKTARTDTKGRFLLAGIGPDATTLTVDGSTANTKKRQYGVFHIRIRPQQGKSVDLGFPVWMTPLDTKHTVTFDAPAKDNVVLTTPDIPGLEVRIPKGSVVRDEHGKPVTELGITAIPIDRPPFPIPDDSVVPVYFTVQPGGTYVFPKGAQIVYPNYTKEPPGTRVEFLDYDPEDKGWYVYGHGTVSADGRQVVPDTKTRVWAFHGAMFNISDWAPFDSSWFADAFDWLSGDPVVLASGTLTDSRTDLAVADPLGPAEVTRTYWQGDTRKRAFGTGRDLSYNAFLHSKEYYQEVDLYLPGGKAVHYERTSDGTSFTDAVFEPTNAPPGSGFHGTTIAWNNDGGWDLTFRDGSVWVFPQYAPLKEIRDRHGNTTKLTRRSGTKGDITRITTPGGGWITFSYDTNHRITEARDNTGRTTSYTYDSASRLKTVTDPAGGTLTYTYDGNSNRIATATDARSITHLSNTYDAKGRVKKQTLTEGAVYDFTYTEGADGQITATEVTEPGGAVRKVTFDADGYGVSDTAAHGTDLARRTVFERGPNHRIDAIIDPYGRRTEPAYDTNGNITSTTELAGTEAARTTGTVTLDGPYDQPTRYVDALGKTTTLTYDTNGDLATITDPEGRTTTYTHTATGQIATTTDPTGAVTEYTYRNGHLISVTDAEGRTTRQFTDAAGRPTVLTDAAGATTTITYDKLNQTTRTTDPLGHTTAFDYDAGGNLTRLTDARGNSTLWTYDTADRPKTATDPLGAQATFTYDTAGRLTEAVSRAGLKATAAYDLLGRTKTTRYGVTQLGQAESTVTHTYDDTDLLTRITDTAAGTQNFSYDAYDRLRSTTGPTGTVTYAYNTADQRTEMAAAGVTTAYGYDDSGILTTLTSGTDTITFTLDAAGREKTATLPGGWSRTTDLDTTGTITGLTYTHDGTTTGNLAYTRDTRGLQTSLTGSLAKIALPTTETDAVFDDANRLTTLGDRSFTYDADGQLTSDGLRDYTWNPRGQLTALTGTGTSELAASFTYDPLGGRTERTVDGTATRFLTDGTNPLAELDAAGNPAATVTTSGLDQFLTRTENGTTQVYLTDALGSVVGLADADGTITTTYAYDPYGQPTASGTPSTNRHTFTGREDDGTGLLYHRNRYYDPTAGRFVSEDPIGHAGGTNLYQYALSSPTTYTDPTGNSPMIAGCVVGGLVDGGLDWLGQRLSGRKVNWGSVATSAALGCAFGMLGARIGPKQCLRNSFTPDTPVLMADGTRKRIEDVRVGDEVLATDLETGESGPRTVTALIKGTGEKHLIDLTVDTDGPAGTETGTLTATDGHPFWVPSLHRWVDAADLQPGQWLRTSSGTWVQITGASARTQRTTVHNLTVDDLHTYYVLAGATPVLVHNCNASLAEYADSLRPGFNKVDGPFFAAKYTSPSGRTYFGHSGHGLTPTPGGEVDSLVRRFTPEGGRYHAGCAETMCLIQAEAAEGAAGVRGGAFEVVKVRGLNSPPGGAHGTPASPCPTVCRPRLDHQGISY